MEYTQIHYAVRFEGTYQGTKVNGYFAGNQSYYPYRLRFTDDIFKARIWKRFTSAERTAFFDKHQKDFKGLSSNIEEIQVTLKV